MELTPPAQLSAAAAAAPETMLSSDASNNKSDQFLVEEFFDFSNEENGDDLLVFSDTTNVNEFQSIKADSGSSASLLLDASCNSPFGDFGSSNLTSELCVPYDDLAELEWVSTFAEESFSSEDMKKLQFISGMSADPTTNLTDRQLLFPGKARSKRPRTAPGTGPPGYLLLSTPEPEFDDPKQIKKRKQLENMERSVYLWTGESVPTFAKRIRLRSGERGPLGPKTLL
ncbi:unnamed protein product [Rhodiola kirilowii]